MSSRILHRQVYITIKQVRSYYLYSEFLLLNFIFILGRLLGENQIKVINSVFPI